MEKKSRDVHKKIPDISDLVDTIVFYTKIGEVEKKIPDTSGLGTTTILLNTKIGEVNNRNTRCQ